MEPCLASVFQAQHLRWGICAFLGGPHEVCVLGCAEISLFLEVNESPSVTPAVALVGSDGNNHCQTCGELATWTCEVCHMVVCDRCFVEGAAWSLKFCDHPSTKWKKLVPQCSTSGCTRETWNGLSEQSCCRPCPGSEARSHGFECNRKFKLKRRAHRAAAFAAAFGRPHRLRSPVVVVRDDVGPTEAVLAALQGICLAEVETVMLAAIPTPHCLRTLLLQLSRHDLPALSAIMVQGASSNHQDEIYDAIIEIRPELSSLRRPWRSSFAGPTSHRGPRRARTRTVPTVMPPLSERATAARPFPPWQASRYRRIRNIAETWSGKLDLYRDLQTGLPVLVKRFVQRRVWNDLSKRYSRDALKDIGFNLLMTEASMGSQPPCPFIARSYGVCQDDVYLYSLQEFVVGRKGDAFEEVMTYGAFNEARCREFMRQVLHALRWLHRLGLSHADLSLENIVIAEDGTARLIDFGCAMPVVETARPDWCGKEMYRAPDGHPRNLSWICRPHGPAPLDLFAAGVCMYTVAFRSKPWEQALSIDPRWKYIRDRDANGKGLETLLRAQGSLAGPNSVSSEFIDLMSRLVSPDPADRPSAAQALVHPWFDGHLVPLRDFPEGDPHDDPASLSMKESLKWIREAVLRNATDQQLHAALVALRLPRSSMDFLQFEVSALLVAGNSASEQPYEIDKRRIVDLGQESVERPSGMCQFLAVAEGLAHLARAGSLPTTLPVELAESAHSAGGDHHELRLLADRLLDTAVEHLRAHRAEFEAFHLLANSITLHEEELRVDPVLDGRVVCYSEMCVGHMGESLDETQLLAHWENLSQADGSSSLFDMYLDRLLREGWGDQLTLRALAQILGVAISVHSTAGYDVPLINPHGTNTTVHIGHIEGLHYVWLTHAVPRDVLQVQGVCSQVRTRSKDATAIEPDIAAILALARNRSCQQTSVCALPTCHQLASGTSPYCSMSCIDLVDGRLVVEQADSPSRPVNGNTSSTLTQASGNGFADGGSASGAGGISGSVSSVSGNP